MFMTMIFEVQTDCYLFKAILYLLAYDYNMKASNGIMNILSKQ